MPELDRLVWAGSFTVALDGVHLGVRASDRLVVDVLREALAAHVVDDWHAPPNFSIVMGRPGSTAGTRPMHALYRGCTAMVRSPSLTRVLEGLLSHLDAAARERMPDARRGQGSHLMVEALAMVIDGRAVLLPEQARYAGPALQSTLRRPGAQLVDACVQELELDGGALQVSAPGLQVDTTVLQRLIADETGAGGVAPGRYPIAGWVLHGSPPPPSRARAVVETAGLIRNMEAVGIAQTLQALTAVWACRIPVRAAGARQVAVAALSLLVRTDGGPA